jgi:hypothetical protein
VLAVRHAMGDRRPTANAAARDPRRSAHRRRGRAQAVNEARLAIDRWVDEGGRVPFEAAAVLRATRARP